MNRLPPRLAVGRFLAVVGSVCLFGPATSFAFVAWVMFRQYDSISPTGAAVDSATIEHAVHAGLAVTIYGLGFGLLGVVMICLAVFVLHYGSAWLRGVLLPGALFLLPAFPIGTVFSLVLVFLYCRPRLFARSGIPRATFLPPPGSSSGV